MEDKLGPPRLAQKLLRAFLREDIAEEVEGDLDEKFHADLKSKSKHKAKLNYWYQTINYLRPFAIKKINRYKVMNNYLFSNYFKISTRNIFKHKMISFINVFSLAVGLAACVAIYLFVSDEQSFDAFHSKKENIYRLDEVQKFTGTNEQKVALSMPGMGPAIKRDFPEVKSYVRFWLHGKQLITKDDTKQLIENVMVADSTLFDVFDFVLIQGDINTCLDRPLTILLTESTALKFFKNSSDALNNTVSWDGRDYQITGILKDIPENSHIQFDALLSMVSYTSGENNVNNSWGGNWMTTYLLLEPTADISAMEEKFPSFLSRYIDDPEINTTYKLFLQSLNEVHLASNDIEHDYINYRKFNGSYLTIFYIIAAFILLIAAVNFMNLTTARASHRWKEIGVRKSVGARNFQLFGQFIFESVMLSAFALVVALLLDALFIPMLNDLIGRKLSILPLFQNGWQLSVVLAGTLSLGILTGIYPSFYMTSFDLSRVLKGGNKGEGKSVLRSTLVVVQFGLAIAMMVSTLIVIQQLSFMKESDIGFDKDQMLLVNMNREANEKFETIKNELQKQSMILGVTASGQRLGNNFHQWGFKVIADTGVLSITPSNVNVDYDYLKVYGIEVKEGRGFSKDNLTDNGYAFVINESFANELRLKETVGTKAGHGWYDNDSLGTIIGVVKDFNFNSLHYKVNTLALVVHPGWGYSELSVKIEKGRTEEGIAAVKKVWDEQVPSYPFDYTFLDAHFEEVYRSDKQMSAVVAIMAGLSILISCIGLFGLAAITIEKKTKEIGVRKVLGATESQITVLLSRNFAMLIAIAFIIVSPITYIALHGWLESFAYRININLLVFVLGGVLALAIGLLTISYHTLRSARANPVKALRYE
ncbi:ABC transporter permease [Chryseotalea sanaruensis]|uniref:ABC transporter permease n=1 Tax=Chryseotalea sanaruensis TaxID=2482724 RepID=A0A401UF86_9BACT|nr:ABC transporter permease [Chryseotalea sanaruensis]GCC53514.1 ABC transporter permease [Chryseotalea sanaruensis]